ncbi:MAG: AarF/ABC1/UbiB kinase family protein [Planctomycetes bacterium]|nr:AarF/ABC1/UbiB kinase family protein [Planctomycetota bacterium]
MTPLQLTRSVQSLNRLRQIARVLTRHGFGHIVAQINLTRFVPVWMMRGKARDRHLDERPSSIGRHLAEACAELGPTFIKLAQSVSTRPDILPQEVIAELRYLQDQVPPFDTSQAMGLIADQIGRPVEECFEWIGTEPLASGSIGQVYAARVVGGPEVVVKVQRPEVAVTVRRDMQLLHWLADSLERFMPELRIYRPTMLVDELEQTLKRELDYVNEASATERFARAFADDPDLAVPKVFWDLSGPGVLTLETLKGRNIDAVLGAPDGHDGPIDRPLVAHRLADAFIRQVFDIGVFHADPHPGNILVEPPAKVGLIDFGQFGIITDELMTQLLVMMYASVNNEIGVIVDALADLDALGPEADRRNLQRELQTLLNKYHGLPIKRFDLATVVAEFSEVIRHHDVAIPRDMMLLLKAIGTVSGVITRLDPDLDVLEVFKPRLKQALYKQFSPPRLARETARMGWDALNVLRQAPGQLRRLLRRAARGTWRLDVRHENIDRLIRELDHSSNRLSFSVVIAAIIMGSSVVISASSDLTMFGVKVQYFGLAGYLLAGIFGLTLIWAIFRSGRLH